ncbi:MAG: hypothetical protein KDK99_08510, partial [Verrucomicrobiales bacterium]|nr:hypothetical protein [Verrucomicrobiales bacterium]
FLGAVVLLHALHPWVTRFGSDARGYGLVLLLMPLLLGCVGRGVQTGKWRWWLLLTFVQFYLVWTHLSAVIAVAATELAAFIFILKQPRERRAALLGRWAAANLLSGMVFLQLFAPCLPGFLHFLSQNVLAGELDKPWFQDSAAALWSSFNFYDADPGNPLSLCLTTHPLPSGLGVAFVICGWLTAALGSWRLARDPARWPLLITLLGGPALLLADLLHSHTRPYTWYWVLFQPWLLLLVLAAMQPAPQGSGRSWRQLTTGLMVVNFVGMALLSLPALRNMARYPIEGCRESVALTRPITNPRHPGFGLDALTAAPGMTTRAYDPAEIDDLTPESLRALIAQARAENKPLYLNFGFPSMLRRTCPEMFQIIDDPTLFEHVATLHGQFFTTTREVWQLRQPTPSTPFPAPKPDSKD